MLYVMSTNEDVRNTNPDSEEMGKMRVPTLLKNMA